MKRLICPSVAFLPLVLIGSLPLHADAPTGFSYPLFDGQTLSGWQVTDCEAVVRDGAILIESGNGFLRSDHRYSDFVLEVEWKALKDDAWDSGVFFRCPPPPKDRPWPEQYQANLRKGMEGNVGGLAGAESSGLIQPGQWNHFELTVVGSTAAMEINGKPAWKADGIEAPSGYIGLQAEVPGGGQFLFRNLRVTELQHEALFNGKDLTGWEAANGKQASCWKVEDELLICTGEPGSWLRSLKEHGDFNLRLEYLLKPSGNSGVYCRVPKDGDHHGEGSGVEIQILDDAHPRYAALKPYQFAGSVYAIVPADPRVGRPPGQWNRLEIDCRGFDYRVTHNGVVVVDASADSVEELKQRRLTGYLGLQNHREEVRFRNLRIGPPQP
ncbi:MAG: DUF1080 domain-containing protein [Pirellulales bacterium]|nr:DUF1080 domain-containing protein [Pirellulales bacterium]